MEYETTGEFDAWLEELTDEDVLSEILSRLNRIERGLLGDSKSVGFGVNELRLMYTNHRLYYGYKKGKIILFLCGGPKSSQKKDIPKAKKLAKRYL
jgi:putative addiction module killer protein